MYNIHVSRQTTQLKQVQKKQLQVLNRLNAKRQELSSKSNQRCFEWVEKVDPLECKMICDGSKKVAVINPITEQSDNKAIEKSILTPSKTHYDQIYVRNYEPEYVTRSKVGDTPYLNDHLGTEPYKGNPDQKFKSLLKQRNHTQEKHRNMTYTKMNDRQKDISIIDTSGRDLTMIYHPDFRSTRGTFYKTIHSINDKDRENGFNLRLNQTFTGKLDPQVWPENKGSLYREDPYIEGLESLGKLQRTKSREKRPTKKEFIVDTSYMNTTMAKQNNDSLSLRQMENHLLRTSETMKTQLTMRKFDSINSNTGDLANSPDTKKALFTIAEQQLQPIQRNLANLRFADSITTLQSKLLHKKKSHQPNYNNTFRSEQQTIMNQTTTDGKVYFKSLEMSQSFHSNKKAQKDKIQEEIDKMKSKTSLEFGQYPSPYATHCTYYTSIGHKRNSVDSYSQSNTGVSGMPTDISRLNFSNITFKNTASNIRFATPSKLSNPRTTGATKREYEQSAISLRLRNELLNEQSALQSKRV